ncbi:probable histone-lysine N-methyltransferase CG1716 [Anastrepha obliqua]|uniref:probable histone-lysine N-methyltransferase CG1716 n=1 Tax=Anastrepha obliqua TaxID=95512 RepID=UPI002409D4AF|nr:probable histone-lysine N-methyltransferase CG1716 [Anastrepha obliqua]
MSSSSSKSDMTPQRKRAGRPPKATYPKQVNNELAVPSEGTVYSTKFSDNFETVMSGKESENVMEVDSAALAISPVLDVSTDTGNPRAPAVPSTSGECRRSSRKKIIKFDVRDLLNKHRKPHKIQIEARIDSNAPQTSKTIASTSMGGGSALGSPAAIATTSDLSSKQKAFMEKSAIFRRISISEQQNRINAPPLPPPLSTVPTMSMLGTINRKNNAEVLAAMDPAKIAQARRLSRTQEIFNASLMKSKQNSSLIVAQIESNSCSSSSGLMCQTVSTPPQQRKATSAPSKRKNISNSFASSTPIVDVKTFTPESGVQKRRGRPPKNKTPTAQNTSSRLSQKSADKITTRDKNVDEYQPAKDITKELEKKATVSKSTLNSATNWKEYKANLNRTDNITKTSESVASRQSEDLILEISSTSSLSEPELQPDTPTSKNEVNESQQRNFASVCIWQESANVCETSSAPEFIVAAVEEITTENSQPHQFTSLESVSHLNSQKDSNVAAEAEQTTITTTLDVKPEKVAVIALDSFSAETYKGISVNRKSSGSESESGSDRSNKSYKKGDKLRVSLKRVTMPQSSEPTSTISLSSASNSCSDVIIGSGNNNNSGESNGSATELSTVATSKALPTRRSHRLPKRSIANKTEEEESKSKLKTPLNKHFDVIGELKMTDIEADQNNALPVECNKSNTAVKTGNEFETSVAENNNVTANFVSEALITQQPVGGRQLTKRNAQNSPVELPPTEQAIEASQTANSNVSDPMGVLPAVQTNTMEIEDERKVCEKQSAALSNCVDFPAASNNTKKERITLPIKKQVSKFKMYEAAVHNVAANVETSTLLDILKTVKLNDLTMGTKTPQHCDEVASTSECEQLQPQTLVQEASKIKASGAEDGTHVVGDLSNINELKSSEHPSEVKIVTESSSQQSIVEELPVGEKVEAAFKDEHTIENISVGHSDASSNKMSKIMVETEFPSAKTLPLEESLTKTAVPDKSLEELHSDTTEANTETIVSSEQTDSHVSSGATKVSNVCEKPANSEQQWLTNESEAEKGLDESSMEEVNPMTGAQLATGEQPKVGAKKTPSPTPSENSTGHSSKKTTRRYERRSQRGEATAHKTLEETFAEIAAESCKAVLDLKAKEVEIPQGSKEKVAETVVENAELEEDLEKRTSSVTKDVASPVTLDADKSNDSVQTNSSTLVESIQSPLNSSESKKVEIDTIATSLEQNIIKVAEDDTSPEIRAKDSPAITDISVSKALIAKEDADSNSNHSSPSRRRRTPRNRKETNATTSSIAVESNENSQNSSERDIPKNLTSECNAIITTTQDIQTLVAGGVAEAVVAEENDKNDVTINATPETNTTNVMEQDLHTSSAGKVVESADSISHEAPIVNASEAELILEPAIVSDVQNIQSDTGVKCTDLETSKIEQQQDDDVATVKLQTDTTTETLPKTTKQRQEKLKPSPLKSRKQKKGMSAKVEHSADIELESKRNDTSSDGDQSDATKPETQDEGQLKVLKSPEDALQNASVNIPPNVEEIVPPPTSNDESMAVLEVSADISSEAVAQNVDQQMLEERSQSGTPNDKPKKVKKRKSTKYPSDEKPAEANEPRPLSTEEPKIVECKEKSNEEEDGTGKTRKPRKGKVSNEPIEEGVSNAASEIVAYSNSVEAGEKEVFAKAPPKKRLLKMQMQLEEKSAYDSTSSELPTTSTPNVDMKPLTAKKTLTDSSKSKESSQKKTKRESQTADDLKKRSCLESSHESSMDEESRSATSTPVTKHLKHHKATERTPEDKSKSSSKRKSKSDQSIGSNEKINTAHAEIKDKDKSLTVSKKSEKKKFLATEDTTSNELAKKMEEKSAKKKRQKKLKEAFEAALKDVLTKSESNSDLAKAKESSAVTETDGAPVEEVKVKESPPTAAAAATEDRQIAIDEGVVARVPEAASVNEPEEEPDPLKDIEKFIEDGVNLLKRGYKIEEDSVDEVICPKTLLQKDELKTEVAKQEEAVTTVVEAMQTPNESIAGDITPAGKSFEEGSSTLTEQLYYETPADTPVATPTTTPPSKSPIHESSFDEISGVRRSHRIKLITKTPKALVGRGLVREKERFSIKDDVEMKTHYSLDDHLTDLAHVEAKNAKFLKEMEERLSNFHVIKENEYKCERVVSREARKMLCDCFLTAEEEERGELGCGEDCLNRLLMIECGPDCNVKDRCTNKRFQKLLCSPCRVFRTEKKGFGIMADIEILPGEFIMEYVGEVIDGDEFERRRTAYSLDKNRHYYFMALRSDAIIDATIKGNISRFINHSCDPNAETQKWTVNGELRIGFFSRKSIMPGEEITFDYQYQRYGREAQRCYCESANCRGWIGEEPNSDEGEQIDEDSDADNLADGSDEDESDESIADTEDAPKRLEIDATTGKSTISADEGGKLKLDEKVDASSKDKRKKLDEDELRDGDDDAKAKVKKLAGKSTDKVLRKKKQNKEKKEKRLRTTASGEPTKTARYLEDPDIEDEVKFLSRGGLRNQSDTLRFSRLVVRAKLPQTRLNLLKILRSAEVPCRRLFLDYHGLRLLHGWMSEDGGDMAIRLSLLEALESLPIANKTVLTDSKVYQSVRNWCGNALPAAIAPTGNTSSPSDESSKESSSSNSQQEIVSGQEVPSELQKLAMKLTAAWNSLPEIFRIPKRERIEQMKEHEREADRQFAEASVDTSRSVMSDRYHRDRFGRGPATSRYSKPSFSKDIRNNNITVVGSMPVSDPRRRPAQDSNNSSNDSTKHLSKEQRRELFAAKVARDEAEKRMAEERREFETKCRFFGLEPKKTRPQDVPFCVDPSTGQWYSVARQPIPTPPCYAHVQVQPKPKSTDPSDYKLPAVVSSLPRLWKYAISPQGQIYYYHAKQRVPQWHPPTPEQLRAVVDEADSSDSESCEEAKVVNESSEDDDVLMGMDEAQLKAFIDRKVENRRHKRYNRLVDERPISPRKEEDRIYNQMEMRKYKENKEKIRKRKEEIRRKRLDALKANPNGTAENANTDVTGSKSKNVNDSDDPDGAIPIQDYLLSSDEEDMMKAECDNSPLLDKIVQGDKIVDELDALTTKRTLKRPLPPHRDLSAQPGQTNASSSSGSGGGSEHKRRKSDKKDKSKKSKDSDSKYRRNKEKFRCEIAGIIVQHLKPYRKESCAMGRIQSDEDFNHLARKLTHFVMVKELKYCESVGQTLVVTESVKNKSREFIKKYMAKYGGSYVKPANDPEFKEIPFTI